MRIYIYLRCINRYVLSIVFYYKVQLSSHITALTEIGNTNQT